MSQIGFIQYFGQDIGALCVAMCRLNLKLYGITPMKLIVADLARFSAMQAMSPAAAEAYKEVLVAEATGNTEARAGFVERLNESRQGMLFEDPGSQGAGEMTGSRRTNGRKGCDDVRNSNLLQA